MADQGLFGPGSVTWEVHASPVMLIGGMRALMIQALHPLALAGVIEHSDFRERPLHRLRRTARYVATVTFGDTEQAERAGAAVRGIHRHIEGVDRVTGGRYSARDVEALLWVHCVEVHSFLAAYRAYAGRLSAADQDRYLEESARSAALVGIPAGRVPASVPVMRAYFEEMLPELVPSEAARETIGFVARPPFTRELLPVIAPLRATAAAAVALVPRHLRRMAGIDQPRVLDAATHVSVRAAAQALAGTLRLPLLGAPVRRVQKGLIAG
jgi:uncharacterized protein (DUF2236 family)